MNRPTPPPGEPRVVCPPGRAYVPRGAMSTEQLSAVLASLRYVGRGRLRSSGDWAAVREWLDAPECPAEHRALVAEWQCARRAAREQVGPAA